ncbi:unnamed protein product [Pedinophyceae sp. YPF-701]|nr:unnamed protein product [Pedinophyceae sp. YPF-701]
MAAAGAKIDACGLGCARRRIPADFRLHHGGSSKILSIRMRLGTKRREFGATSRRRRQEKLQAIDGPCGPVEDAVTRVLFTEEQIQSRVQDLGRQLAQEYAGRAPLVVCTLTGAFVFHADLVRAMRPCPAGTEVDFLRASSYGAGTETSGNVLVSGPMPTAVRGRHVILVEDIVDTGITAARLVALLKDELGAASVALCALLDKPSRRQIEIAADVALFVGFECPNEFVVGYGLDYDGAYRTLGCVGVLDPAVYGGE